MSPRPPPRVCPPPFPLSDVVVFLVLEAHRECMEACVEGNTLRDVHKMSVHLLSRALSRMGIVQKSTQQIILRGLYKPYYPHSIGHWLGMDTHDVHTISAIRPFVEGTVLTIEPGLYLPRTVHEIPSQYRGIGIRLEDDVVVSGGGREPEVLSAAIPVEVDEVEAQVGSLLDAAVGGGRPGTLSVYHN